MPMAPAISPLVNFSSNILVPPSTMTAAASCRLRSFSLCQDVPAAAATCAPVTSAAGASCDFSERSTIHGVAPARSSTSATKRASLLLVFIVANTATIGLDAPKKASRDAVLPRPNRAYTSSSAAGSRPTSRRISNVVEYLNQILAGGGREAELPHVMIPSTSIHSCAHQGERQLRRPSDGRRCRSRH